MALYDYVGALKKGKKQYQLSVQKGEYPYLPVLDDLLSFTDIVSEARLGLTDIPLNKIVGTRTKGRTNAFASNFMPLLSEKSEFGAKWAALYDHQIEEGIRDPIEVYEFMNQYYVQEGNKRVSVLKYVEAVSINGYVTRLIPKKTDDKDTRLYYEFLDFYQVSFNCDIWFSKEGSYDRLLKAMGKGKDQTWTEEEREYFKAIYDRFTKVFQKARTEEIQLTCSDAFLVYVELFGYETVKNRTETQISRDMVRIWDELLLASGGGQIALMENPEKKESSPGNLMDWLRPGQGIEPEQLKIAFIHARTKETSSWTYGHELGRLYLEQAFGKRLKVVIFDHVDTEEDAAKTIDLAIASGCNVIFTTASPQIGQSVKAAIQYPKVRIFNCSVNMSYSSVRTYDVRLYEAKFLMGALAAAMSDTNRLGYVADYPIYGAIANINAFALGARMINPRVRICLEWSGISGGNALERLHQNQVTYISGEDLITPEKPSREYGLYHEKEDGTVENLATPICHWGRFYEQMIRLICQGEPSARQKKGKQAVNYWWGMSADVVDVICSQNLPDGISRLIRFLKHSIRSGSFQPFDGPIYGQDGTLYCEQGETLSQEAIIAMNWLAEHVDGNIPERNELTEEAQALMGLQGIQPEKKRKDGGKTD